MLDICQILLILIEIWKIQKENQLYAICLGAARYFLFKYLTKSELFVAKLVVNPSQIYTRSRITRNFKCGTFDSR